MVLEVVEQGLVVQKPRLVHTHQEEKDILHLGYLPVMAKHKELNKEFLVELLEDTLLVVG